MHIAVTNAVELGRLAGEQAALRRVATLVAQGAAPGSLFAVVAEQVARVLNLPLVSIVRYEGDGTATECASFSERGEVFAVGTRWSLAGTNVVAQVRKSCRPARIDDYSGLEGTIAESARRTGIRSTVGIPIAVAGRLWGAMVVSSAELDPLPADTEASLADFTELVATAIANTEARAEVGRLADEQAALRRVATLVARQPSPDEVFAAVAEEVGRLVRVDDTRILRYEADGTGTVVADWGEDDTDTLIGTHVTLEGDNVAARVFRTGQPTRIDDYSDATGSIAAYARKRGTRSTVGAPIVVEGRLWGVMVAASRKAEPLPAATESRVGEFTELVATAISNIQARSELAAAGARIVAAADEERRRVVRDLHDGAQQSMVNTVLMLKLTRQALENEEEDVPTLVTKALEYAEGATAELRELAHGILPSVLTHGGLRAGVEALTSRMPMPVDIAAPVGRLPAPVEATAYFVVAEALTNVAKHSKAQRAEVSARVEDGTLLVHVRDDGVGGARPDGSGLLGLGDRLAVLHGRLAVESPPGDGTLVAATIPLTGQRPELPRR
jgi:signal transduction histidine kinase